MSIFGPYRPTVGIEVGEKPLDFTPIDSRSRTQFVMHFRFCLGTETKSTSPGATEVGNFILNQQRTTDQDEKWWVTCRHLNCCDSIAFEYYRKEFQTKFGRDPKNATKKEIMAVVYGDAAVLYYC